MRRRLPLLAVVLGIVMTLRGESEEPGVPLKPADAHAKLKKLEGTWEVTAKYSMMAGAEPMKGKGTIENKFVLSGVYLQSVGSTEIGGKKSESMATFGYNLYLKKYFFIFFIAETGGFVVTEGQFDKEGKVLTLEGAEELPDGQEMKAKAVFRFTDDDEYTMEFWFPGEDGKQFLAAEYTNTRKK
ncbi:MAG: DUF1579 family protein [Planctomycetota bacterium]